MSTQKKYMGSSHFKNTAIAIAVASSFAMAQAWAADTAVGSGNGVAYGTGSQAAEANNVAIGNHATISYSNGATRPATLLALPLEILQLGITLEPITTSTRAAALLLVKTPSLKTWRGRRKRVLISVRLLSLDPVFWVYKALSSLLIPLRSRQGSLSAKTRMRALAVL